MQVANYATGDDLFALAQNAALHHLERAFQASSPKNFQGPDGNVRAFFSLPQRRRKTAIAAARATRRFAFVAASS
jgi:hypothetical protein